MHQMNEPAGLLGMAQQMHERAAASAIGSRFPHYKLEASAALHGGSIAALEWILSRAGPLVLDDRSFAEAAKNPDKFGMFRCLLDSRTIGVLKERVQPENFLDIMQKCLHVARTVRNFELIALLFPHTLDHMRGLTRDDIHDAVEDNDPFTRQYLFGIHDCKLATEDLHPDGLVFDVLRVLLQACGTGNLALFIDTWDCVRYMYQPVPELFNAIGLRIDQAVRICTSDDLTPVMMVLTNAWDNDLSTPTRRSDDFPYIARAARWDNLPVVRLWLAAGRPAHLALHAAVKHRQRAVATYLIAHGADPSELSASDQQLLQSLLQAS